MPSARKLPHILLNPFLALSIISIKVPSPIIGTISNSKNLATSSTSSRFNHHSPIFTSNKKKSWSCLYLPPPFCIFAPYPSPYKQTHGGSTPNFSTNFCACGKNLSCNFLTKKAGIEALSVLPPKAISLPSKVTRILVPSTFSVNVQRLPIKYSNSGNETSPSTNVL